MKDKTIEKIYEERRASQAKALEARRQALTRVIPDWEALEKTWKQKMVQFALKAFNNPQEENQAGAFYREIEREKAQVLRSHGFPEDYLDLAYHCPACHDTGWSDHHTRCRCYFQLSAKRDIQEANLSEILRRETYDRFDLKLFEDKPYEGERLTPRKNMEKLLEESQTFVADFPQVRSQLFFGDPGTGKTFLIHCMINELLKKQIALVYYTAYDLINILEDHRFNRGEEPGVSQKYGNLFRASLLVVDDLGTEMLNSFTLSELFNLINRRINQGKTTIISTNLGLEDLRDQYTERIFSRFIQHYDLKYFYGDDLRLKKFI